VNRARNRLAELLSLSDERIRGADFDFAEIIDRAGADAD